jgi:hypothetical protein
MAAAIVPSFAWLAGWTLVRGEPAGVSVAFMVVGALPIAAVCMEALFWLMAWLLGGAIERASDCRIRELGRSVI